MGQFKPMVKMQTTEPSVILKLKKGGTVKNPVKKMDGGIMGALANAPAAGGPAMPSAGVGRRMAARKGRRPSPPTISPMSKPGPMSDSPPPMMGRPPMEGAPMGRPMIPPAPMKKGGETPKMHAKEMTKMSNLEKEMSHHESMKASKAHKGLKTGGVVDGPGGFKTGGVVKGPGGFKKGGLMHGGSMHGYKKGGKVG